MDMRADAVEPPLFALRGPVPEYVLDEEMMAIERGAYPSWRVVREERRDRSWSLWQAIGSVLSSGSRMFANPLVAPVRTVVVEHAGYRRRRTLVFEYLGCRHDERMWRRAEDPARERSADGFDPAL